MRSPILNPGRAADGFPIHARYGLDDPDERLPTDVVADKRSWSQMTT